MLQCAVRFKLFIHNYYKVLGIWFSTCFLATNFCWSILIYFRVMYIYWRCYKSASNALRCIGVPWIYYVCTCTNTLLPSMCRCLCEAEQNENLKLHVLWDLKQRQVSFRRYKLPNCRRSIENNFKTSVVSPFFYVAVRWIKAATQILYLISLLIELCHFSRAKLHS